MRPITIVVALALLAGLAVRPIAAQTVLDQTLSKVNGQVITRLDIRQVRLLKLVRPDATTEPAILRELENRYLMLAEVRTAAPSEPTAEERAAHRREWEASLGPGASVADLLARSGMSEGGLENWLRDDLRIQKYQGQRFGGAADKASAIETWIQDLRRRAGLGDRLTAGS